MVRSIHVALLVALLLVAPPPAAADAPPAARARQLYAEGSEHFRSGRIARAIAAFEQGYRLVPRPEFLLNLSQCYRALGQRARAMGYLRRFVRVAPDHPLRPAAEHTLAELTAAAQPALPRPVTRREAPAPVPVPSSLRRELIADLPDEPPRTRRRRSGAWRWVLVGAGIAATAAGIALGVYYGTRADDPAELGTVTLPPP
jgi:tetratricopeptide (TPR) repeat protein